MQPGGHRFDPGQLHHVSLVVGTRGGAMSRVIDGIIGLGPLLVPIVAILVGGVIAVVAMVHRQQERMAKIAHGIDPDAPWPHKTA